jgi:hypothetical protein
MQKQLLHIVLLLAAFGKIQAQDEPTGPKMAYQVGVQTNALFERLHPDTEGSLVKNPYLLVGKVAFGKQVLRLGVGGAYDRDVERVEGFANTSTLLQQQLDIRLGTERVLPLGERWSGSIGLDAVAHWGTDKTVEDSGFDVITDTDDLQLFGGGLVGGLKFQATRWLSFGTEAFVYYTKGTRTEGEFFKNFPTGEDKIKKTDVDRLQIGLPNSLFILIEF